MLDPISLSELYAGEHCDMPELFERLQSKARRIVAYPLHEPWLDVGRLKDFQMANNVIDSTNE